ncbi:MAG: DMT family transporter [Synergistaceae bacterium]|jgi:drug/metabolite transporter (DMT)-like permease|nr:DMT family transporter [Synergistaceae bacterium]
MVRRGNFHVFATITILGWSISYVLTRMAMEHFSARSLGFLRYAIATAVLAAVACSFRIFPPARKDWGLVAASGATGFFLYMIAFNTGAETETAAVSSIVIATAPVMTALLGWAMYGERLASVRWAAIAIEFTGILMLNIRDGSFSVGRGILWLLLAAFLLSVFNLLQRKLTKTCGGLRASVYSIFAGAAMLAVFSRGAIGEALSAQPEHLFYVAMLGVFSSAVSYVSWSMAIERAPSTSSVSNYMFITPLLAAALGFAIANERPDLGTMAGGTVILFGVFLFNFAGRSSARVG